jgi:hypothetical protein
MVAKTGNYMIVDHTGGLHKSVTNGGSPEFKAPLTKIQAHLIG